MRWAALDGLRGLAVALMLAANSLGAARGAPAWLRHAEWDGLELADLVAPLFLFVVGLSIPRSRRDLRGAARRAAGLFALGLALNAALEPGQPLRVPGILQRIALAYLAAFALRRLSPRARLALAAALLAAWTAASTAFRRLPTDSLPAAIDQALVPAAHLFRGGAQWAGGGDPEGFGTLPCALALVLLGSALGEEPRRGRPRPSAALAAWGGAAALAALAWSSVLPFNRALASGSYVLFCAGASLLALAAAERHAFGRLAPLGRRALPFFLASAAGEAWLLRR